MIDEPYSDSFANFLTTPQTERRIRKFGSHATIDEELMTGLIAVTGRPASVAV